MTTKKKLEGKPNEVPENHPIAGAFPAEIDVPISFRLGRIVVKEFYERERDYAASVSHSFGSVIDAVTGQKVARPEPRSWIERRRVVNVRYVMQVDGVKGEVEVEGEALLDGLTFGPEGKPDQPELWAAAVKEAITNAIDDAKQRIHELIDVGLEAEKEESAKA